MIRGIVAMAMAAATAAGVQAAPVVTDLGARYRAGQVFLTWQETAAPDGTTFNVYASRKPIGDTDALKGASLVCRWIEPHSAEDWTRDKGNYGKGRPKDRKTGQVPEPLEPVGYIIEPGGERLDPASGLHVHTVLPAEEGSAYYAVTAVIDGEEDRTVVPGANALLDPVVQSCAPIEPIWQGTDAAPEAGSGAGKPLLVSLHAKGNRPACSYIVFGDATHAWREGIPFMFDVAVGADRVALYPSNTMYVGRSFNKGIAAANKVRGIWTFWYGCSDQIPEPEKIAEGTPINYSERRLLYEIAWVKQRLGTDPHRTYCTGSSMGGCGTMSFAFRHPEIFAAVSAHVPIVAYNSGNPDKGVSLGWHDNTFRLEYFCGPLSLISSDGLPLKQRLDSTDFVENHAGDLPFLVIANGRQDRSIPWHNNPPFYRALQDARQGCVVAWNNGTHPEVDDLLPADLKEWKSTGLMRFALNKSYPAFSRCSRNSNPGNGDNNDGDIEGYMNRGLNWDDPAESAERYELTLRYDLDETDLPLTVDVTPRRCQAFSLEPGQPCTGQNIDSSGRAIQSVALRADRYGVVTFPAFQLTGKQGNRLVLKK